MNDNHESRRSFRVSESVHLDYEILSDEEFYEGLEHRKVRLGRNDGIQAKLLDLDARLTEAMYLLTAEGDKASKCIALLNDKVNAVIDQLPDFRRTKTSLANLPVQTCDVSADGMVFAVREALEPDAKLAIRFLLVSDNRYVETFCRVLRQAEPYDAENPKLPHAVAVEFYQMSAAQKEILIQHMFSRESETLRMRRLQIDSAM